MSVTSNASRLLHRYGAVAVALVAVLSVAIWPVVLVPLARAYLHFNARHLQGSLLDQHYPPYVIAALIAWASPLVLLMAVLLARQVTGQYRLERDAGRRRLPLDARCTRLARQVGLGDRLVVIDDGGVFAFCAGLLTPRVYVSQGLLLLLAEDEIEAVLRHEATHLRRRDPLRLFLADLLQIVCAPFPAAQTLSARIQIGIELTADRAALTIVPLPTLASALVKVARAGSGSAPLPATLAAAGLSASQARIDALLGRSVAVPFDRRDLLVTSLVLLTLVGALAHLAGLATCHICPSIA